jgi:hypothetical protein
VKEEGLFSFGGKKPSSDSSGCLKLLKFGQTPLKWSVVSAKGKPPLKRWGHTMNLLEANNDLVVCGGFSEVGYHGLMDLHVFSL